MTSYTAYTIMNSLNLKVVFSQREEKKSSDYIRSKTEYYFLSIILIASDEICLLAWSLAGLNQILIAGAILNCVKFRRFHDGQKTIFQAVILFMSPSILFDDYFALLICIILKVSTMQLSTVIFGVMRTLTNVGKKQGLEFCTFCVKYSSRNFFRT